MKGILSEELRLEDKFPYYCTTDSSLNVTVRKASFQYREKLSNCEVNLMSMCTHMSWKLIILRFDFKDGVLNNQRKQWYLNRKQKPWLIKKLYSNTEVGPSSMWALGEVLFVGPVPSIDFDFRILISISIHMILVWVVVCYVLSQCKIFRCTIRNCWYHGASIVK